MPDLKQQLERAMDMATRQVPPEDYDRFVTYRERRRRNQRLAAGAVALVLVIAVIGSTLAVLRTSDRRRPGASGSVVVPIDPGLNQPCGPSDACWDADIFTMVLNTMGEGSSATRLGVGDERDFAYSWSPDGQRIAFYVGSGVPDGGRFDATADIFTMTTDGSDVRQLTDAPGLDLFPVYSPDGSRIAFTSDRDGPVDVWVMNADGSDQVNLTAFDGSSLDDYHPTWSPDGTQIAFVRGEVPPGGDGKLWVIDADGSNAQVLLDTPLVAFPMWSPDGGRIAFMTGTADWRNSRIQILDLATGDVTDVLAAIQPRWAPDGTHLLVSVATGTGGFGIVDLNAPNRIQMLRSTGWAAAFSPDGTQVLFSDAGLTADGGSEDGGEPVLKAPPPGETIAGFTESGIPFLVVRHGDGSLTAVDAASPYLAYGSVRTLLGWCGSRRTFDDAVGGAKFDEHGRYIYGPSPSGLTPLSVEIVTEEPLTFRLGDRLPELPREETGESPTGELCLDATSLLRPGIAAGGLTPAELAASEPPIEGTRWSVEGTMVVSPDGEVRLCATYIDRICEAEAAVDGPFTEGPDPIVIEGTWYVVARNGVLTDPIAA